MTELKKYNLDEFIDFYKIILKRKFYGKLTHKEIKDKVDGFLNGDNAKLSGKAFYLSILALDEDIDLSCKKFFKNYTCTRLLIDSGNNKLYLFLNPFINSNKSISEASGVNENRLAALMKECVDELYAKDIYGLSIAFGIKPSVLFHYFYGDGEKPVVGV